MPDPIPEVLVTVSDEVEQLNLRVPAATKEFLEKLATASGSKVHPYVLSLLEAHVDGERERLVAIYRKESELAAKTAAALDRRAAKDEAVSERAAKDAAASTLDSDNQT
ncbi:MAG: hypothetical protein QOJ67_3494 [Acidimicrobiaceae bacterium]